MKKLYISVPMKGRTDEQIRESINKMWKMTEIMLGEECQVLPTYNKENREVPRFVALGRSIAWLGDADYVVYCYPFYGFAGVESEVDIANNYDIPTIAYEGRFICPDIFTTLKLQEEGEAE